VTFPHSQAALTGVLASLVSFACTRARAEEPKAQTVTVARTEAAQAITRTDATRQAPPRVPEWRAVADAAAWKGLLKASKHSLDAKHFFGFDKTPPALLRASLSDDAVEKLGIPVPQGADALSSCGGSVAFTVGSFLYVRDQNGALLTARLPQQRVEIAALNPQRFLLYGFGNVHLAEIRPGQGLVVERVEAGNGFTSLRARCETANAEPQVLAIMIDKPIAWWTLRGRSLVVSHPLPAAEDLEPNSFWPMQPTMQGFVAFEADRLVFINADGLLGVQNLPFQIHRDFVVRQGGATRGRYLLPAQDGKWFESLDAGRTWQPVPAPAVPEGPGNELVCNESGCLASGLFVRIGWTGMSVEPPRDKPLAPSWPAGTASIEPATELHPSAGPTNTPRGMTLWFQPKAQRATQLAELVRLAQLKLTRRTLCDTEFAYCHQSACASDGELTLALTWTGEGDSSPTLVLGNGSTFTAGVLDKTAGPRGRAYTVPGRDCGTPSCDGNEVTLVAKNARVIQVRANYWNYQESANFCGDETAMVEDWFFNATTLEPELALRHDFRTMPTYHLDADRIRIEVAGSNYFYRLNESAAAPAP
jgi:hypothetical protein